jgi:hypothetical protein
LVPLPHELDVSEACFGALCRPGKYGAFLAAAALIERALHEIRRVRA